MVRRIVAEQPKAPEGKTYLGYYMPFPGVRYYGLFTEEEVRRGLHHIGPVGWRRLPAARDDAIARAA